MNESDPHWRRVQSIFHDALDRAESERVAFLDEACGDDAALRRDVERMLASDTDSSGFLRTHGVDIDLAALATTGAGLAGDDGSLAAGTILGRHRLVERIGRGGMGEVWKAELVDDEFDHAVAIKILRRGLDTDDVLARFRRERQLLARLDHPNIARLIDGGTAPDGRPYLVMELVEGRPLDVHCSEKQLSIRERLELFATICETVHDAHARLVVHRDLKPSNVLVNDDGVPKLLDFGIATVLDPESDHAGRLTVTGERIMTPRYASPEQVRGGPISTATDVYALGVMLYELLTGRRPYDAASGSRAELEHAVATVEPTRPSEADGPPTTDPTAEVDVTTTTPHLRRQLRGDLDTIVLVALRKEPERRYRSALALAEDIRAHLDGRPVAARGDSAWYRASRVVRRHPVQSIVAALAIATIAGLAVFAFVQRDRALDAAVDLTEQLAEVERQKAIADGVNEFYTDRVLGFANPEQAGQADMNMSEALDRASAEIDGTFEDAPLVEAAIRHSVGYFHHQRSEYDEAIPHLERAWRLRTAELGPDDLDTLIAHRDYANALLWSGRREEAIPILRDVLATQRRVLKPNDGYTVLTTSLLGMALSELGHLDEAIPLLEEAWRLRIEQRGESHAETLTSMNNLATAIYRSGDVDRAIELFEQVERLRIEKDGAAHPRTLIARANLATVMAGAGRTDDGIRRLEAVRNDQIDAIGETHGHTRHVLRTLIDLHVQAGNLDRETELREARIDVLTSMHGAEDPRVAEAVAELERRRGPATPRPAAPRDADAPS